MLLQILRFIRSLRCDRNQFRSDLFAIFIGYYHLFVCYRSIRVFERDKKNLRATFIYDSDFVFSSIVRQKIGNDVKLTMRWKQLVHYFGPVVFSWTILLALSNVTYREK
jgi:hypothetical protein